MYKISFIPYFAKIWQELCEIPGKSKQCLNYFTLPLTRTNYAHIYRETKLQELEITNF
jgi:hypothetical protein